MPSAPTTKPPSSKYVAIARTKAIKKSSTWGNIEDVVNAPLIGVTPDASWLSVIFMWLLLPINVLQALVAGLVQFVYRDFTRWADLSYRCGRPLVLAWVWWRYLLTGLVVLFSQGRSRLSMFLWEWRSFGSGDYFYHGEGIWCWKYPQVEEITRSHQDRKAAFGCIAAPMPDVFPPSALIFLPNTRPTYPDGAPIPDKTVKDSEWWAIRSAIMTHFLGPGNKGYFQRVTGMKAYLRANGIKADSSKLADAAYLNSLVVRCIFYVIFGDYNSKWLSDDDVATLTNWRNYAIFFVLPRLLQRFFFNLLSNKIKELRVNQAHIIDRLQLREPFQKMNQDLPREYQRSTDVELMDQVMYVIGFAGIGGTSAGLSSTASFLLGKTGEVRVADSPMVGLVSTE